MSSGETRFKPRDWMMATLFFAVGLALRVPFRSHLAYHWDSAQFTLAISQYDIRLSQPHAPGYFLYVILGRLVNQFVGDPHASLVWISVVFGSALPSIVYLLATAMFGRSAGLAAGLLALTSPQVWFHSGVALTYVVDSFLVCTAVLILWRAAVGGGAWRDAVVIGVLLAVIGGIREQSLPALVPLVVFSFWRAGRARVAKLILTMVVAVGLGLLWLVPMVRMSGGTRTYLEIVRLHAAFNAPATLWGGGWSAFLRNVACVAGFCWNGLVLAAVVLVGALFHRAFRMTAEQKQAWSDQHAFALAVLAMWVVPMMALGTVVGFTKQPGYVLSYLPGWFVLVAATIAHLKGKWPRMATILVVCAANVVAFAAWPPRWDGVFFGIGRTAREISTHDARLSQMVATIRRLFPSGEVVVCHADEFDLYGLRHFQLYLPEYDHYQLAIDSTIPHPEGKPIWRARNGLLEFVGGVDLGNKEGIVLLVPPEENIGIFKAYFPVKSAKCLMEGASTLYFLPAEAAQRAQKSHID